jgi:hypothetical protein
MNIDLDITNYDIPDLEKFFKLMPNYNEDDVETKEEIIRKQIINSTEIKHKEKDDIITFLNKVKILLKKNLITKTVEPVIIHSKVEEFVQSNLNPLEKRITTKSICIDSLFRENYNKTKSTDFLYKLPITINNVASLQLTSFEFPNTINTFSSANHTNTFDIDVYNVNTGTYDESDNILFMNESYKITIPDGNYTQSELEGILNNIFQNIPNSLLKGLIVKIGQTTIIRARNHLIDTHGPYVYESTDALFSPDFYFKIRFALDHTLLYKTAGWTLGFRKDEYIITQNDTYINITEASYEINFNTYLSSESMYNTTSDNYIFLEIDDFHNNFATNTLISTNSTSYIGKNILARIVLKNGTTINTVDINENGIFKKREYFGPIKLEKLKIRLLNKFGDVIDLRYNDYSFVLGLKLLY